MSTHLLYDSVTATGIPSGVPFVAGYVDGLYSNIAAMKAAHPHAYIVTITVTGEPGARVADIETGDLTPAEGAAWAHRELVAGHRPTLYVSESVWPQVIAELSKLRIAASSVDFWIASWTSVNQPAPEVAPPIPAGACARQYAANVPNGPASYDLSVCLATWPLAQHPAPTPPTPPHPTPAPGHDPTHNRNGVGIEHQLFAGHYVSRDNTRSFVVDHDGSYRKV